MCSCTPAAVSRSELHQSEIHMKNRGGKWGISGCTSRMIHKADLLAPPARCCPPISTRNRLRNRGICRGSCGPGAGSARRSSRRPLILLRPAYPGRAATPPPRDCPCAPPEPRWDARWWRENPRERMGEDGMNKGGGAPDENMRRACDLESARYGRGARLIDDGRQIEPAIPFD